MDKLRAMATFVHIVEAGSLTNAAERLGTSLTSVVRSLSALEQALGVRLLNRTTRRIALTDEGREYFERCRELLAEIDEAEAALGQDRHHGPSYVRPIARSARSHGVPQRLS
jgi:DNA-binding transcriptional LysR family regulator